MYTDYARIRPEISSVFISGRLGWSAINNAINDAIIVTKWWHCLCGSNKNIGIEELFIWLLDMSY